MSVGWLVGELVSWSIRSFGCSVRLAGRGVLTQYDRLCVPHLGERFVDVRHVSDAKGDAVHVKAVVFKRQFLRIRDHKFEARRARGAEVGHGGRAPPPLL